jgi:hypothetical protein
MHDNWLSNRVSTDDDDIVGHCSLYWNRLIEQPWRTKSIALWHWMHRS